MSNFMVYEAGGVPIKAWVDGVPFENEARLQLERVSRLPFAHKWVAAMPDIHAGMGATIGSVIATQSAVIPAAVGVDIGCGVQAVRTSLGVPEKGILPKLRAKIEKRVPTGFSFHQRIHRDIKRSWSHLEERYHGIVKELPDAKCQRVESQLGTLGGGNHFIEVSLDEDNRVWVVIHSGSRNVGNRIGTRYIRKAKEHCKKWHVKLEDPALAYFPKDTAEFTNYMSAVMWAQEYARTNRDLMMLFVLDVLDTAELERIDCHHNYVAFENHFGENMMITRKGAVSAQKDQLGIIPGSMGARSYIVKGLGNNQSFNSCSHGAGRAMSRSKAKKTFTVEDHEKATAGIECRKDKGVLDETPAAYKDIDAVMAAQKDLCEPVHTLRQILCVKG